MQDTHGLGGDQRRLLGRLRHHGVAGDEPCAYLAEEDGERKIPRTDADENTATAVAKLIALAGRPRHPLRTERAPRLDGVEAAEIDRLAHLGDRIVEGLAALALHQRDEATAPLAQEIA